MERYATVNGIDFSISLSVSSLFLYRNATDFSVFILNPATLLNSFIDSNVFWWSLQGFLKRKKDMEDWKVYWRSWQLLRFFFVLTLCILHALPHLISHKIQWDRYHYHFHFRVHEGYLTRLVNDGPVFNPCLFYSDVTLIPCYVASPWPPLWSHLQKKTPSSFTWKCLQSISEGLHASVGFCSLAKYPQLPLHFFI